MLAYPYSSTSRLSVKLVGSRTAHGHSGGRLDCDDKGGGLDRLQMIKRQQRHLSSLSRYRTHDSGEIANFRAHCHGIAAVTVVCLGRRLRDEWHLVDCDCFYWAVEGFAWLCCVGAG